MAANTLQVSVGTAPPEQGIPVSLAFSGTADATDSSGDGSHLFAVARAAGGVGCQPTFDSDQAAAESASTTLIDFDNEAAGSFSETSTFNPPNAGSYLICAWLESDADGSTDAGPASAAFSARGPQVEELAVGLPSGARPGKAYQIDYTTQTDQQLTLDSTIKPAGGLPCASSYQLEQQQNQNETDLFDGGTSVFGGPMGSTATDTENRGPYVICSWIEGPNTGEVDAAKTTPIYVGTPPAPQPPPKPKLPRPGLHLTHASASRRHGATIEGTAAKALAGRVVVYATCGKSSTSTSPRVRLGKFGGHVKLPGSCRRFRRVELGVVFDGSKSFLRGSGSESVRVRK